VDRQEVTNLLRSNLQTLHTSYLQEAIGIRSISLRGQQKVNQKFVTGRHRSVREEDGEFNTDITGQA